jgi:hypothetical protein
MEAMVDSGSTQFHEIDNGSYIAILVEESLMDTYGLG